MDESLPHLIDQVEPGAASALSGLSELRLESRYLPALEPNPQFIRLFYRHICHESQKPKASLVIVHGFGETSKKYMEAGAYFALAGYDVHVLDQRHCGLSGGCRLGHDAKEAVRDVNKLLQQVRSDLPCFIWGHSLGGLLVTYALVNNPMLRIAGAVLTAPAYRLTQDLPQWMKSFYAFLAPSSKEVIINFPLPATALSRNDSFIKSLLSDTLNRSLTTVPMLASIFDFMTQVSAQVSKLKCPVLFMHGDKDVITSHRATEEVYQKCGSADKTLSIYPGGYHELHHDYEKEKWLKEVQGWLDSKTPTARPVGSVGKLRVAELVQGQGRWKVWVAVVALVYVLGVILFKAKTAAKTVHWLAYTLVPKLGWPVVLPLSRFLGKR